ncbi:MAG: K(+)-transporting ATPase subunit F [Methylocella sp.]
MEIAMLALDVLALLVVLLLIYLFYAVINPEKF